MKSRSSFIAGGKQPGGNSERERYPIVMCNFDGAPDLGASLCIMMQKDYCEEAKGDGCTKEPGVNWASLEQLGIFSSADLMI